MAFISILDNVKKYSDKKENYVGIYRDLTKAFTVQQTILLDKLYHYGVRGVANSWYMSVNACNSEMIDHRNVISCHFYVPTSPSPQTRG